MPKNVTKLSVNLPTKTCEDLRAHAEKRGITMTEAIREALGLQDYLFKKKSRGSKILLEKNGKFRQIVLFE